MSNQKRKYLVIRLSSIGDIILTTPILRAIKNSSKDIELHYLVKKSFSFVTDHLENADKVWLYDKEDQTALVDTLKGEGFDSIIDLHRNMRTLRLRSQIGVEAISFDKLNIKKWLLVNTKLDLLPNQSIVDRYYNAVASLGIERDGKGLDFKLMEDRDFSLSLSAFSDGPIAISLGASFFTKRIPITKIHALLENLEEDVILLGGKDVEEEADQLVNNSTKKNILNLCGKTTLNQSAIAIDLSRVLITSDSAMMHIGAALKSKMIVCWGNTVPQFGMGPYYGDQQVDYEYINELPKCKPCSKLGFDKCPKGHFKCMEGITINRLKESIHRLI